MSKDEEYLLIEDDKSLIGSVANFLFQINDLLDAGFDEVTFSFDQFLAFVS